MSIDSPGGCDAIKTGAAVVRPAGGKSAVEQGPLGGEFVLLQGDVDGNGSVNAQDILAVITLMSAAGPGTASSPLPTGSTPFYYDVNADGIVNVFDILGIISYMAAHPPGEGEGQPAPATVETPASDDFAELLALVADDVATSQRRWSR